MLLGWCQRLVINWVERVALLHIRISEYVINCLNTTHEKLIQWIVGTKCIHADNFTPNISIKLETHSHFAAFRQWAVFSKQDYIKDPLDLIVCYLERQLFILHLGQTINHEILKQDSLIICCFSEIAKCLIVCSWQVKVKAHKGEDIFGWSTHYVCWLFLLRVFIISIYKRMLEYICFYLFCGSLS